MRNGRQHDKINVNRSGGNMAINKIVIVGGGSSGWMTAAMLSKLIGSNKNNYNLDIKLVESEQIGTIGVGEATIPAIKRFNSLLQINEADFLAATQGTFKLGIQFKDWGHIGESYIHGFGKIGRQWDWLSFYQYWLKLKMQGKAEHLDYYNINTQMALSNKFYPAQAKLTKSPLSEVATAYHFDANLYGQLLSNIAVKNGVKRVEGMICKVNQNTKNQHITSIKLTNGKVIEGDLFIDCSGMKGLLIEQCLQTGYEDWSHWLPCDSAVTVASMREENIPSFTRSKAHEAGWQWKIPLQSRTGNGHVYSSNYISNEKAEETLLTHLDSKNISDVKKINFKTGKRHKSWNKNCIAIGLSSGFLEPLESTSLYLVQTAILRLIKLFPDEHFHNANINQYNQETDFEIRNIRDFIIAHYKVTDRDDSEFWRYCKHMDIPDSLKNKLDIFSSYGRIKQNADELFREESWVQVLTGQGMNPVSYDPLVDLKTDSEIFTFVNNTKVVMEKCLEGLPSHNEFIAKYCQSISSN